MAEVNQRDLLIEDPCTRFLLKALGTSSSLTNDLIHTPRIISEFSSFPHFYVQTFTFG